MSYLVGQMLVSLTIFFALGVLTPFVFVGVRRLFRRKKNSVDQVDTD